MLKRYRTLLVFLLICTFLTACGAYKNPAVTGSSSAAATASAAATTAAATTPASTTTAVITTAATTTASSLGLAGVQRLQSSRG